MPDIILSINNLTVSYGTLLAADRISFDLERGKILGIVGESGSGKSTVADAIMGLLPQNAAKSGEIVCDGQNLLTLSEREFEKFRGSVCTEIFQTSLSSLNPVMTIESQLCETLRRHSPLGRREAKSRAADMLRLAEIDNPKEILARYPHELSGGQRQRAAIALALSCNPKILIADEPTSSLDVSVEREILDLLSRLNRERGLSIILISHDFGAVSKICDSIIVMYGGQLCERGSCAEIMAQPCHEYTKALLRCIPFFDSDRLSPIAGAPACGAPQCGCAFYPRCPAALDKCARQRPSEQQISDGHFIACSAL